jgi:DNA-directed RNA polymerase specialized sigma24 family protein
MRRNWLGLGAVWARRFRPRPLVPDATFQDAAEPYPGHWRRFPAAWAPPSPSQDPALVDPVLRAALDELSGTWRRVLLARDAAGRTDAEVAAEFGLTVAEERAVLARARAAVRDRLDDVHSTEGPSR